MRLRLCEGGRVWVMLMSRQLSSLLAVLGLLYSAYLLLQMLVLETTVPTLSKQIQPRAYSFISPYLMSRNTYLQEQLSKSHPDDLLKCPINIPVLQVLDHGNPLSNYIACPKLLYNRVPKCGSRTLISVIKVLGKRYNFTVEDVPKPATGLNYYKNISHLNDFVSNFTILPGNLVYTKHLHYVNFTKFGRTQPLYINVIRDPVERLISHYYYNQYGSQSKPLATPKPKFNASLDECVQQKDGACLHLNTIIPFFCGHDYRCRDRSVYAVQRAKRTVRESYQVVGITEDLDGFMEVLEALVPQFFFNASLVYKEHKERLHQIYQTVKKPVVSEETISLLKEHLSLEYDFYRFIKQRYYTVLTKIRFERKNAAARETRMKRRERKLAKWWESVY